ncbi:hypothetical protein [Aurantimonas coralicida]|uniref:hypothetical protein n=1 Tax=Aurantimonas coralicida TaxID=182270 RepID=UPI001E4D666C|nr:hypothetical protein [Aurantimonas coralicida]MCD1643154.1 hypothetical protein [Aurantimonas coralicida]
MRDFALLLSALIGGAFASVVTISGQIFIHWYKERPKRLLEDRQKSLLIDMLQPNNMPISRKTGNLRTWRSFNSLRDVIGADGKTTRRLLIEIGARRAISTRGKNQWALLENKPLSRASAASDADDDDENMTDLQLHD